MVHVISSVASRLQIFFLTTAQHAPSDFAFVFCLFIIEMKPFELCIFIDPTLDSITGPFCTVTL